MRANKIPLNLIYTLSRSYCNTTGIDYEDLVGVATIAFFEAKKTYSIHNGAKFSSWAWMHIDQSLKNYVKSQKKFLFSDLHTIENTMKCVDQFRYPFALSDFLQQFSNDCQEIIKLVLENDQLGDIPPRQARSKIVDLLREKGWSWSKIWDSFRDLKKILKQTSDFCII